jgi:hypothetical protein
MNVKVELVEGADWWGTLTAAGSPLRCNHQVAPVRTLDELRAQVSSRGLTRNL